MSLFILVLLLNPSPDDVLWNWLEQGKNSDGVWERIVLPYLAHGYGAPMTSYSRTLIRFLDKDINHSNPLKLKMNSGVWTVGLIPYMTNLGHYAWNVLDHKQGRPPALEAPKVVRLDAFLGDLLPVSEHRFRGTGSNAPVMGVTFQQAREYCKKHGGRLPTPAEWEVMARGVSYYKAWPWGEAVPLACAGGSPIQCRSFIMERDVSPHGFRFMGSYPHWTEENGHPVIKGGLDGGWFYALVAARRSPDQVNQSLIVFRCVYPVSTSGGDSRK